MSDTIDEDFVPSSPSPPMAAQWVPLVDDVEKVEEGRCFLPLPGAVPGVGTVAVQLPTGEDLRGLTLANRIALVGGITIMVMGALMLFCLHYVDEKMDRMQGVILASLQGGNMTVS